LATDHAGFALKEKLKAYLQEGGHDVQDMGAHSLDDQDDYPDFIRPLAEAISKDPESRGIILGGSGQGEAMAANRVAGVRAAVYYGGDKEIVVLSREHNDANILSLGARFLSDEEAKSIVKLWLGTAFSGEVRHQRRIDKIDKK
ncbi:MAG: ribose-5-phosphate isomerase, partial [Candidatus Niyogibacteria bacterium CG10_big_fil_rev_8_21_14_0_10_46_36]